MKIFGSIICATACAVAALILLVNMPAQAQVSESVTTTVTPVPDNAPAPAVTSAPATPMALPSHAAAGIPMISGGIGDDELARIKSLESQYNLKLLFTEHNGMYLANVHVKIDDKSGKNVVTTIAKGPILLLTLPKGSYNVSATESGETHDQKVNVTGKSLASYVIRFRTTDTLKSE